MKKQNIFILYDLGISLTALSNLYKFVEEKAIKELIEGNYLEVQFKYQIFTDKDIELLSSEKELNKSKKTISDIMRIFNKEKIEYYFYYEEEYPSLLKSIPKPPFMIFMKGNKELLEANFLCSIVGTRKPSFRTIEMIKEYVKELVRNDVITVSGLALGTDIIVHQSTLYNQGKTIAVLPSAINNVIPKKHKPDAERILKNNGLLISEYYKEDGFNKKNYIDRNRIISGISQNVIIAECGISSGTMHTARFAYKQRKRLFCFDNDSSGIEKIMRSNSAEFYRGIQSLKS
ncbi:DNA-protecting protein DprA [Kurthia gibsonii]|uniref:DNA-processing protein DprA n=1 Tax=Kurthia gibsonii TaxID=33946 RepID=UPI002DBECE6B|nr:DNA-processing protein DprA [Kurthia gibsonii]MEB6113340.1 DNA-protecting protein DprA [Kurthia gibsonii]